MREPSLSAPGVAILGAILGLTLGLIKPLY